jgi:hypothetical protein
VRKFSKNLAATSKFEVHKISSTCCPTNIWRLPTQLSLCRRGARDLCTLIYMLNVRAGASPAVWTLQCPPFASLTAVRQPCNVRHLHR